MRIGIEVQRLFRKKRFGIEISALELLRELYKLNTRHELIVLAKDGDNNEFLKDHPEFNVRKVGGKFFVDFEQLYLPIAARREKLDVLHCTGNTTPVFSSVPIVQTLHDVIFMDPIPKTDSAYQRFGNYYRRVVVPIVSRKSDVIITVSEYEKKRIVERLRLAEDKIHVIHNGIATQFRKHEDKQVLQTFVRKYNLPETYILFIGNSAHRKNPERALEAYARYCNATGEASLALVTPGLSRDFVDQHLKSIQQEHVQNRVHTPGYIDSEDLPLLYSCSSVFLFPSLSEGFGMPILEAMASGIPVVTSNISAMPEIAGQAARLVDPYDAEAMALALTQVLSNSSERAELVAKGLRRAEEFRWSKVAERTLEIYERVYADAKATSIQ